MWSTSLQDHKDFVKENKMFIGASLSEPHIDRDNVPRGGECLYLSIYLCMWPRVAFCRLYVPDPVCYEIFKNYCHQTIFQEWALPEIGLQAFATTIVN